MLGSSFQDCAFNPEHRKDHFINVVTHCTRGDSAQSLGCEIHTHVMQYTFIVKKRLMGVLGELFGWRKVLVSH